MRQRSRGCSTARPTAWAAILVAIALSVSFAVPPATAQTVATATPSALAVEGVSIPVSDLDRAREFYTSVLDFVAVSEAEVTDPQFDRLVGVFGVRARILALALGQEEIELIEYMTPGGRPIPVDSRSNDLWFQHIAIIVSDMDRAYERLRAHDVDHASTGPQRLPDWNPAAGGIEAFYFKDPDGHTLEILAFPEGKGDPRWHQPGDRLFLGIDHTAIAVRDTEASLRFYRDFLGMKVAGESENWGPEQERLNNVFGARLRITSLRTPAGPAIELLEYLAPTTGRPMPVDSRAPDLWHWVTRIAIGDVDRAVAPRPEAPRLVSPGGVDVGRVGLGFGRGAMVRDPDGHAMLLVEQ